MARDNISKFNSQLTKEQCVERARKAGKASGEARARRKSFREALEVLLTEAKLSKPLQEKLKGEGVSDEDMNHMTVILRSLIAEAEQGNVQAFNAIIAQIGEKPADRHEIAPIDGIKVEVIRSGERKPFPSSEDEVID